MRKRWRAAIFTTALLAIGLLSLFYSSRALADLVLQPGPADTLNTKVILSPTLATSASATELEISLLDAQQVVAQRLEQLNLSQPYYLVSQEGHLAVTLPDSEKTPYILSIITYVGEIEFIDGGAVSPPIGREIKTGPQASPAQNVYQVLFTGQDVEEALPPDSSGGQIFYRLTLNATGARHFTDFVETRSGNYVCMVMDKQVINCSAMYHWGDNTLDILPNLGGDTAISLADLGVFLESGPLPVPLQVEH